MDSEFTLQVKTCSKGRNLLQGVYPVVNFFKWQVDVFE